MTPKTGAVIVAVTAWLSVIGLTWQQVVMNGLSPAVALIVFVVIAAVAGAMTAERKQ